MPATRRQAFAALAGISGAAPLAARQAIAQASSRSEAAHEPGANKVVGLVDHEANGFTPHELLTEFDYGDTSTSPDGRTVREWTVTAVDKEIEIAPGVFFPAWTYQGRVPGPALRCVEGERLKIHFVNAGSHAHSIHLHSIHAASMDGVSGPSLVEPGTNFTYEIDAVPFGCHLYHCHALPLKRHIHKGLYGALIIDPDPARHPNNLAAAQGRRHGTAEHGRWQEFVMVMNGFDTNFDEENEFYAANSIAFAYANEPIRVARSRPIRIYLVNVTEFDLVNSLHLHGNFYDYYDHGTTLTPTLQMVDTVMQCQGQRGIIEIDFSRHEPGLYMFHAHQSEFAELGWMSFFDVTDA
ncbi:MAG: multicopper oxidase domain-containing protein [Paracoccaceae bacterium]|nr:multicopper oxidase domain-containing protein [Paracoccaceae bacterium]